MTTLWIADTQISDSGLKHLESLSQLLSLKLTNTKVTDAGRDILRAALPTCSIDGHKPLVEKKTVKEKEKAAPADNHKEAAPPNNIRHEPQTSEGRRERESVLASIAELALDDRKIASELYEKLSKDVLSLSADEAEYAVSGNGSSALALPFAEEILAIVKQGVPDKYMPKKIEFGFWQAEDVEDWHLRLIFTAAKKLKLDDKWEIYSLCQRCFINHGEHIEKLSFDFELLSRKELSRRTEVMEYRLDDLKREPLFKHLLEDYLRWATSDEPKREMEEQAAAKLREEMEQKAANENEREAGVKAAEVQRIATEKDQQELRASVGQFEPQPRSELEKREFLSAVNSLLTKLDTRHRRYADISGEIKSIINACRSAKDRQQALSELTLNYKRIISKLDGFDGRDKDADSAKGAQAALKDFDAGMQIIFPGLTTSEMIQEFLLVGNRPKENDTSLGIDVTVSQLSEANSVREKLEAAAE